MVLNKRIKVRMFVAVMYNPARDSILTVLMNKGRGKSGIFQQYKKPGRVELIYLGPL